MHRGERATKPSYSVEVSRSYLESGVDVEARRDAQKGIHIIQGSEESRSSVVSLRSDRISIISLFPVEVRLK